MEQLSIDFKNKAADLLRQEITKRGYTNAAFYRQYGITEKICIRIKTGRIDDLMPDSDWFRLSRKLGVGELNRNWNLARTDVFCTIEEDILFCQRYAKAKICVDECGIGKTYTAKYLSHTLKNCFYVDASQGKTIYQFTKVLALALGININGKLTEVKEDIKAYLKIIPNPIVIIDEAGDLSQVTIQEIKEYWNFTEGFCGWYLMGADGLKYIIDRGIKLRKPGFKEVFSRFSERYTTTVPTDITERNEFYRKLITDVLTVNMVEKSRINEIVKRCLIQTEDGSVSGLRRAESLLILHS